MELRIQYATTSDGVRIAFAVHGEGRPLVTIAGWPWTHLAALVPTYRLFHETLAARCRVILFDGRGTGLSDRNPADISLEARVRDVEAVMERLGLKAFDLVTRGPNGPAAILYATRHPDEVQHLILWDSSPHVVRTEAMEGTPRRAAIAELMSKDWELFTETVANVYMGWSAGEPARRFASALRECVTPEMAVRATSQALQEDVEIACAARFGADARLAAP